MSDMKIPKKEVEEKKDAMEEDDDDDMPISKSRGKKAIKEEPMEMKEEATSPKKKEKEEKKPAEKAKAVKVEKKEVKAEVKTEKTEAKGKREREVKEESKDEKEPPKKRAKVAVSADLEAANKWWENVDELDEDIKWRTLEHHGVVFPPPYAPHGVKMLYKGKPVELTPEQEEVANFWATLIESEWVEKPAFRENFKKEFFKVLGKEHTIKNLEDCDFKPIFTHFQQQKELKKSADSAEKNRLKEEKQRIDDHYGIALVDGVREKVGNFRIEPPGLFRGRGEHPKAGMLKARYMPEEVTINIGEEAMVPKCDVPGRCWKDVVHSNTVTWLAYWKDNINQDFKYVWLSASSKFKGLSDMHKYEKARKLKDHIDQIRRDYVDKLKSKDEVHRQLGTALYLIDKLALRVGNEKGEDEADTVGCCSLRIEHIEFPEANTISLDFLGKDSMRYQNTVQVDERVYQNLLSFTKGKKKTSDLFHSISASSLNDYLKGLMDGLSAKVFRTYNASITLQEELGKLTIDDLDAGEKVRCYNDANRAVAILCNHQRSLPKNFNTQMEKMQEKLKSLEDELEDLKDHLATLEGKKKKKDDKKKAKDEDDEKKKLPADADKTRKAIERLKTRIKGEELKIKMKEDNKTVALGTSKINYMDPRITVAWCKRNEVPIEKVFNKSLRSKFPWAMYVEPDWSF